MSLRRTMAASGRPGPRPITSELSVLLGDMLLAVPLLIDRPAMVPLAVLLVMLLPDMAPPPVVPPPVLPAPVVASLVVAAPPVVPPPAKGAVLVVVLLLMAMFVIASIVGVALVVVALVVVAVLIVAVVVLVLRRVLGEFKEVIEVPARRGGAVLGVDDEAGRV